VDELFVALFLGLAEVKVEVGDYRSWVLLTVFRDFFNDGGASI
jgi:hypothetical protein